VEHHVDASALLAAAKNTPPERLATAQNSHLISASLNSEHNSEHGSTEQQQQQQQQPASQQQQQQQQQQHAGLTASASRP
jgi:hypothetical protein